MIGGAFTIISARLIGMLTDKIGAYKSFAYIGILSFIPVITYTHLGVNPLWKILIVSTSFMMMVSGRFIPAITMITKVPDAQERGLFMSVFNALRSFSTRSAAFCGGLLISEASSGELVGYENVGYISIAIALVSIWIARQVR